MRMAITSGLAATSRALRSLIRYIPDFFTREGLKIVHGFENEEVPLVPFPSSDNNGMRFLRLVIAPIAIPECKLADFDLLPTFGSCNPQDQLQPWLTRQSEFL